MSVGILFHGRIEGLTGSSPLFCFVLCPDVVPAEGCGGHRLPSDWVWLGAVKMTGGLRVEGSGRRESAEFILMR